MTKNNFMTRMNISLTNEQIELLKRLAEIEHRPYSQQIVSMMEFYIENNPEVKKKLEAKK